MEPNPEKRLIRREYDIEKVEEGSSIIPTYEIKDKIANLTSIQMSSALKDKDVQINLHYFEKNKRDLSQENNPSESKEKLNNSTELEIRLQYGFYVYATGETRKKVKINVQKHECKNASKTLKVTPNTDGCFYFGKKHGNNKENVMTDIDFYGIDNLGIKSLSKMLEYADRLETAINVDKITTGVNTLECMFENCMELKYCTPLKRIIDLGSDKSITGRKIDINSMFRSCNSLSEIDMSGMNFSVYQDVKCGKLYRSCTGVKIINMSSTVLPKGFKFDDVFFHLTDLKKVNAFDLKRINESGEAILITKDDIVMPLYETVDKREVEINTDIK